MICPVNVIWRMVYCGGLARIVYFCACCLRLLFLLLFLCVFVESVSFCGALVFSSLFFVVFVGVCLGLTILGLTCLLLAQAASLPGLGICLTSPSLCILFTNYVPFRRRVLVFNIPLGYVLCIVCLAQHPCHFLSCANSWVNNVP